MKTLDEIINYKREEVLNEKSKKSSLFDNDIFDESESCNFLNAIKKNEKKINIIAEVKRCSPSRGLIRKNFDPIKISEEYYKSGATCLSVLTDKKYFGGDNSYISKIKETIKLPVLRKDFIIDPWQIKESKFLKADCILLILSCLSKSEAKDFEQQAFSLNLDVIVEVHNEIEIEIANEMESKLIGINNRNLKTMDVNIQNSIDLSRYLEKDKIAISESGIKTKKDIDLLVKNGFKNFLIGEAFMEQKDIQKLFQKLISKKDCHVK